MKLTALSLALLVADATAYSVPSIFGRWVTTADKTPGKSAVGSGGTAPASQTLPAKYHKGAIRKKLRYGPYTLPSTKQANLAKALLHDPGMVDDFKIVAKPCSDCMLLYAQAGLEYQDGTIANTDTGSWLHHIVMYNLGPGRKDAACGTPGGDPFFSGGNEREVKVYTAPDGSLKSGYYIKPADKFMLYSELMNQDPVQKKVWITSTYEYLPGKQPGYMNTKALWLQLGQCNSISGLASGQVGGIMMPKNDRRFTENSPTWRAKFDGTMLYVSGHLHDGGTNLQVFKNDKLLCDSKMHYGQSKAYRGKASADGMDKMDHISSISNCTMMGKMKKGDRFHIAANYDFTKHPGMKRDDGKLDEVMGIAEMYVAVPNDE